MRTLDKVAGIQYVFMLFPKMYSVYCIPFFASFWRPCVRREGHTVYLKDRKPEDEERTGKDLPMNADFDSGAAPATGTFLVPATPG